MAYAVRTTREESRDGNTQLSYEARAPSRSAWTTRCAYVLLDDGEWDLYDN